MKVNLLLKSSVAACFLFLGAQAAQAVDNAGSLHGVVKDASGKPVAGAFVKLRNDKKFTFMVISQDKGVYDATDLPAGNYTVEGVGGNFESKISDPIVIAAGASAKADISLTDKRGPSLPAAWPDSLPVNTAKPNPADIKLPDGPGKDMVEARCTVCHDLGRVVALRTTEKNWVHTITSMRSNMAAAKMPDMTDADAATIAKYLATAYGPLVPYNANNRLPRTLLKGDARDYRVVTFHLTPDYSEPHDIAVDPTTGIAWAAKRGGEASAGGKLIRFDPHTLDITEVDAPPGASAPSRRRIGNPQIGPDGVLWTADAPNSRWLSFNTKSHHFAAYFVPDNHIAGGNSMALDHVNNLVWSSDERQGIYSLDPKTAEWHFYQAPTKNSGAYGIAIAGDGTPWFAEDNADNMGYLDLKAGKVQEVPIPKLVPGEHILPRRMNSDGDGNLWVGLWQAGRLMKIDYKTHEMTQYQPPSKNAGCYSVSVDKKNNIIWVSEQEVDKIGRFDPATKTWMEFTLPDSQTDDRRIEVDPTDPNRVFFSGNTSDLIGFIEYTPGKKS